MFARLLILITFLTPIYPITKYCLKDLSFCAHATLYGSDSVLFNISSTYTGWASVAVNYQPYMDGADAFIVWSKSDGTPVISDRNNRGHDSLIDTSQDLQLHGGFRNSEGLLNVAFSRKLKTADSVNDLEIHTNQAQYWLIAYSNLAPTSEFGTDVLEHDGRYPFPSPFIFLSESSDNVTYVYIDGNPTSIKDYDIKVISHGVLMFLAWGVLTPLSVYIAMYEKKSMGVWWFRAHVTLNTINTVFTLVAFGVIVATVDDHFDDVHKALGLVLVILSVLFQMPLGVFIDKYYNDKRTSVPLSDQLHWWLGRLLVTVSFVNVSLGLWEYILTSTNMKIIWFVWLGLVILPGFAFTKYFKEEEEVPGRRKSVSGQAKPAEPKATKETDELKAGQA